MKAINKNINVLEGSFIVELYDEAVFNTYLLSGLIADILSLVKEAQSGNLTDSEIIDHFQGLFFIYCKVVQCLIAHFDNNDLYLIQELSENYNVYMDRFRFSLEMLLKKDYESVKNYIDEMGALVN